MRKYIVLPVVALMLLVSSAFAGDITGTGMHQGDLYKFLEKAQNVNLVSGALAAGTADYSFKTAAAITFYNFVGTAVPQLTGL